MDKKAILDRLLEASQITPDEHALLSDQVGGAHTNDGPGHVQPPPPPPPPPKP